jgi:hypothetical protein
MGKAIGGGILTRRSKKARVFLKLVNRSAVKLKDN